MDLNGIFSKSFPTLEKSLDLRSKRHNLIASNISNMDTPGYKGFDIMVDEEICKTNDKSQKIRLEKTNSMHFPIRKIQVDDIEYKKNRSSSFSMRGDGNAVNIDNEMTKMAENSLLYSASAQILAKKFAGLKMVINGGK